MCSQPLRPPHQPHVFRGGAGVEAAEHVEQGGGVGLAQGAQKLTGYG